MVSVTFTNVCHFEKAVMIYFDVLSGNFDKLSSSIYPSIIHQHLQGFCAGGGELELVPDDTGQEVVRVGVGGAHWTHRQLITGLTNNHTHSHIHRQFRVKAVINQSIFSNDGLCD